MNKYRRYIFMLGLVVMTGLLNPLKSNAQPDAGCDPLDPACPIDGGLSLLIAAGIGIGARKAYQLKKKEEKEI